MSPEVCELSVVVPAYHEAGHLAHSLRVIAAKCAEITTDFELIVVDDGSTDATWDEIQSACAELPHLRGVRLSRNFGKEAALFAGLTETRGRAVAVMDADLQHPVELLPAFYRLWQSGAADVVEGVKRRRDREPLLRRQCSRLFNWGITLLAGEDFHGNSDFKLLDRRVVDALLQMPERRSFFRGMVGWLGFRHAKIEFDVQPRQDGHSQWTLLSLVRLAMTALVSYSALPLRVIHFAAAAFLLMALALGMRTLWLYLNGTAIGGFTTVILLIQVLGALVLFSLGVIAEYLGAVYEEVKGRPRFMVSARIAGPPPVDQQLSRLASALDKSPAPAKEIVTSLRRP